MEGGLAPVRILFDGEGTPMRYLNLEVQRKDGVPCYPVSSFSLYNGLHFQGLPENRSIRLELRIYLDKKIEGPLDFFYSSFDPSDINTPWSIHLDHLEPGQWHTISLSLPDFLKRSQRKEADLSFTPSKAVSSFYSHRKFLFRQEGIYLNSLKVIPIELPDTWTQLRQAVKTFPSHFETRSGQATLTVLLLFILIACSYGAYKKVLFSIFLVYLIPLTLFIGFGFYLQIPLFETYMNGQFEKERQKMEAYSIRFKSAWQLSVADYMQEFQQKKKLIAQRIETVENSEEWRQDFEKFLREEFNPMGTVFFMSHNNRMYRSTRQILNYTQIKRFFEAMYVPFAKIIVESQSKTTDQLLNSMDILDEFEQELKSALSNRLNLVNYYYTPELFNQNFIVEMDVHDMFYRGLKSRNFWSFLRDSKGDHWYMLAKVQKDVLVRNLVKSFNKRLENLQIDVPGLEALVYGKGRDPHFPYQFATDKMHGEVAAVVRSELDDRFIANFENGKLRFYLSTDFKDLGTYNLIVSIPGEDFLLRIQNFKNQIFYLIFGFTMLMILFSIGLGNFLTRPFQDLVYGLQRVKDGDLSLELEEHNRSEVGRLSLHFNKMILALRQKEFVSRFVSRMALGILETGSSKPRAEDVSVMYAGLKNIHDLLDGRSWEGIQDLNEVLTIIQDSVVENGGFVDKFTGEASLCLFRDNSSLNAAKAAIKIRDRITNWSLQRQRRDLPTILLGIGIASGKVILGHVGSAKRADFTIIGNTVNMAARLGSMKLVDASHAVITLDQNTISSNEEFLNYSISRFEGIPIKGKKEAHTLYVID